VGSASSGEGETVVTPVCYVTPASTRNCVSSVLIFKGAKEKNEILAANIWKHHWINQKSVFIVIFVWVIRLIDLVYS
jgi:hypothetical protein